MALSPDQLAAIDRHLRQENWLLNESLVAELTDHYATAIVESLAQGIPFDLAIVDVHKGFGGQKGLLKMEEEYALGQYQQSRKVFKQVFRSYFRPVRIVLTSCLFVGFIQFAKAFPHPGRYQMIAGGVSMLVSLSVFAVSGGLLIHKFRQHDNKKTQRLSWRHIGTILIGFSVINFWQWCSSSFVPASILKAHEPVFTALLLTLSVIYALSSAEYILRVLRQFKPA